MQLLLRRIYIIVVALVVAFAITAVGQGLWGAMALANVKLTPALPWAAIVMPIVLAGLAVFLSGRHLARTRARAGPRLRPPAPLSRRGWVWSLAAGAAG